MGMIKLRDKVITVINLATVLEKDLDNLPLIIFSSLASEDNIRKWRNLGANDILTKPDLPNLVKVVDNLVQDQTALA